MVFVLAMVISMALIPLFVRLAPVLGMVDLPDPRKVHLKPIPRVGGVGLVVGALVPLAIWLPHDSLFLSFLYGSLILFIFGLWDDAKELGHYVKFIGQFIAVGLVVFWGDLYVHYLPLVDAPLSEAAGKAITFIAMVGMINAINHSDGLDGLAGGESLMSLVAIAYLAGQADGVLAVVIGVATIGGVFGFLRFNSHPANVFMGDGGSQFLGFTLAFLAVYLTQIVNPALSPALPLLFLGLPIADIIGVFVQRIYHGMNWFRASKNHIHHRLLELGFHHHESVLIIYTVQLVLVVCAVLMPYEVDMLLLAVYFGVVLGLFLALHLAERSGWRFSRSRSILPDFELINNWFRSERAARFIVLTLQIFLLLFAVGAVLLAESVSIDLAWAAGFVMVVLGIRLLLGYRVWFLYLRLLMFVCAAILVYALDHFSPDWLFEEKELLVYVFFGLLLLQLVLAMKFIQQQRFRVTPLDYLVVVMVIVAGVFAEQIGINADMQLMIVQMVILFYAIEWVLQHMRSRWNLMTVSSLAGMGLLAFKGLF